ncbi:hypothetical protein [Winogradskyella sp. UBA3174]|uniref:hypothetical protein n=1 Tax=Winogradskyella sp. UBA3174 TaxID=1947785 RepID=UPI0025EB56E9|nr:hypothetical protein [Winogradskyella sp. UBA3174]|tara:strand:- start:31686 stop:32393 length:708 start_codon:yes stop_codon:yes gene_type:complete
MKFQVRKSKILYNLFIAIGLLIIGNLFSVYLLFSTSGMEDKVTRLLVKLFNVNLEANLPTYFSALVLLGDSILLALIAFGSKALGEKFWHWIGLSAIFVFISLDEMIQIHEQLRAPMEALFNTSGLLYFAWFIPYLALVVVIGIAYFKFMMRLPKKILKLFILSGVVFVFGAVGMEMLGGLHSEVHGEETVTYALMYSFEEFLEMSGAAIFFYGLISYIEMKFKTATFTFGAKEA